MKRNELIESLGISDNTFRKWCKAHDIATNKSEYEDSDLKKLEHCQKAMTSKMGWEDYLQSIGKEPRQQTFSSGLVSRYSPEIEKTADVISDGLLQALDMAVAKKFNQKLSKPSSFFSSFLVNVSSAPIVPTLANGDMYYLEGEIVEDEELGEIPEAS